MRRSSHLSNNKKSLVGKVIVITGASSGAGRAAALEFAKYGVKLVLAARRLDVLNELVAECEALGATAIASHTDVTDAEAVKSLAQTAFNFGGRIDVWVNNAGVMAAGSFNDTSIEVHDQVIKTNLMGYIHGAYAAIPFFKMQGSGILINNISIGGFYPTPYAAGYTASKFGLRGFSEALKGELHSWRDIHVCDLYPAFLDTPGIKHAANYTGKVLKPAPPVYDPRIVGRAMVRMAINPKKSLTLGAVAYVLHAGYFLLPATMRLITAKVMETYFKQADPAPSSSGNIFDPMQYGTTVHGGWGKTPAQRKKAIAATIIVGGLIGSMIAMKKNK